MREGGAPRVVFVSRCGREGAEKRGAVRCLFFCKEAVKKQEEIPLQAALFVL